MPNSKKQRGRKNKEGKKNANKLHKEMEGLNIEASQGQLPPKAATLLDKLFHEVRLSDQTKPEMDTVLTMAGHNLTVAKNDPYGDGDQSPIGNKGASQKDESLRQIFRTLWANGGDVCGYLVFNELSSFSRLCAVGNAAMVEKRIKATSEFSNERKMLLEKRETGMRLSPLLMTIYWSKQKERTSQMTRVNLQDMNHLRTVKVLLKYGARPDVRDVTGKTMAHYGAGSWATDETMLMNDHCVEATKACDYFGKDVVLRNLSRDEFNGLEGTLGGFIWDDKNEAGRRQVKLNSRKGALSIQPKNIFYLLDDGTGKEKCVYDPSRKLVDMQDRMGMISMHEVFMSTRTDVARHLTNKHSVNVELEDRGGISVLSMAFNNSFTMLTGGISSMAKIVRNYQMKVSKVSFCLSLRAYMIYYLSPLTDDLSLLYESKRQEQDTDSITNNSELENSITLTAPDQMLPTAGITSVLDGQEYGNNVYRKPNEVDVDELFWIKVQANATTIPLMVYDKTRTCSFFISPGAPGFNELYEKVRSERGADGRKAHFKALFDGNGNCVVFPDTAKLLSW